MRIRSFQFLRISAHTALEFIAIHNPDTAAVDVSGWAITKGADFIFPPGASIPANGFVVVAASLE